MCHSVQLHGTTLFMPIQRIKIPHEHEARGHESLPPSITNLLGGQGVMTAALLRPGDNEKGHHCDSHILAATFCFHLTLLLSATRVPFFPVVRITLKQQRWHDSACPQMP